MDKKKKVKIAIGVFAVCIIGVVVAIPSLYCTGSLVTAHPLNKPQEGQIRVACVGDSITYGNGVRNWPKNNYPAVLGGLLGDGYCVNNYGWSGRTALYDGDYPYAEEKLYQKSLAFNPDIVVIMLGSNDSKPYNWKGAAAYSADLEKLIDSYLALESSPTVIVVAPPPAFLNNGKEMYDIKESVIAGEIRPAVLALAAKKGLSAIDMYAVFENKPELFSDGVHPNAEGAKLFAATVAAYIK